MSPLAVRGAPNEAPELDAPTRDSARVRVRDASARVVGGIAEEDDGEEEERGDEGSDDGVQARGVAPRGCGEGIENDGDRTAVQHGDDDEEGGGPALADAVLVQKGGELLGEGRWLAGKAPGDRDERRQAPRGRGGRRRRRRLLAATTCTGDDAGQPRSAPSAIRGDESRGGHVVSVASDLDGARRDARRRDGTDGHRQRLSREDHGIRRGREDAERRERSLGMPLSRRAHSHDRNSEATRASCRPRASRFVRAARDAVSDPSGSPPLEKKHAVGAPRTRASPRLDGDSLESGGKFG